MVVSKERKEKIKTARQETDERTGKGNQVHIV